MAILTDNMKRVVLEQRLVFVATICPDGTPAGRANPANDSLIG